MDPEDVERIVVIEALFEGGAGPEAEQAGDNAVPGFDEVIISTSAVAAIIQAVSAALMADVSARAGVASVTKQPAI